MATLTQTFQYVNANFNSLLNKLEDGTLTAISMLDEAGTSVVAKIVPVGAFNTANALGGSAVLLEAAQLPYASTPMHLGVNGLYKLTKQMRNDQAIVDSAVKASNVAYRAGPDGVDFTAKAGGTGGNSLTVTVVAGGGFSVVQVGTAVTITIVLATTTMTNITTGVNAASGLAITAATVGAGATLAVAAGPLALAGGTNGVEGRYVAYELFRTAARTHQVGVTPVNSLRAVMIPKAYADQLNL